MDLGGSVYHVTLNQNVVRGEEEDRYAHIRRLCQGESYCTPTNPVLFFLFLFILAFIKSEEEKAREEVTQSGKVQSLFLSFVPFFCFPTPFFPISFF